MTKRTYLLTTLSMVLLLFFVLATGCKKEDDDVAPTEKTTYDMYSKDLPGVSGTVTFSKTVNATTVEINLSGISTGSHPAHIHYNSALAGGGIALTLNDVDANGQSTTLITKLDNNTAISYEQLIDFDGYVNVHENAANLNVILAQGDIGANALTGASKTYELMSVDSTNVSGTAKFEKRKNNNTLITISLTGTIPGDIHPAQIHLGNVNTVGGGPIVVNLSSVNGTTGKSYTNVSNLLNGTAITYDNWTEYNGYINILQSVDNPFHIIAQGNIGPL
jgi:Cu/Zn superoxide dismutase